MQNTIGIAQAREGFADLVNRVGFGRERFVVERRGKPVVALINAFEYQQIMELLAEGGINDQIHGIPVRVRFDGERYFISDEIVDLYGIGDTIENARKDYWLAAQETFSDLTAHADQLAPHLQAHLAFLRDIFLNLEPTQP
jgi:prevent-host-death family protein